MGNRLDKDLSGAISYLHCRDLPGEPANIGAESSELEDDCSEGHAKEGRSCEEQFGVRRSARSRSTVGGDVGIAQSFRYNLRRERQDDEEGKKTHN